MLKDITRKGLLLGVTAGLLATLFDGFFMLIPNLYVPYNYPFLLIAFNTLFWMTIGGLSGFFLWIFVRKREHVQGKWNFYWTIFFLLPFATIYGLMGRFYIPFSVWAFNYGSPVFDHNLSFLWVFLILAFLVFYFRKLGNKKEFPPVFFALEMATFILLFHYCSNFLYIKKITGLYQIFFQDIKLEWDQFLIVAYILGILSIAGVYFIICLKIRPFISKKPLAKSYWLTVILFLFVSSCLTGFFTWNCKKHIKKDFTPLSASKNKGSKVSHVILIVLDTVRADRLSIYGNPGVGKNLEELSKDALVFENCVASSSWTVPSHASIFTGFYPTEHGSHGILDPRKKASFGFSLPAPLSEEFLTLAEIFRDNGYKTAASISNLLLLNPALKLDQGFQILDRPRTLAKTYQIYPFRPALFLFCYLTNIYPEYNIIYRRADVITRESIHLLEKLAPSPFLLFINYMDAHLPYGPPRPFAGYFLDTAFPQLHRLKQHFLRLKNRITDKSWYSYQLSQYDGELAYLDDELGRFFSRLKEMGIYDSSLIIVTSDHGELFGEHGFKEHRVPMYEGVVKIPLLIKLPYSKIVGLKKGMITLADLFPTILSICGLPIPDGISGKAMGNPSSPAVSELYKFETGEHRILYDGKYKYMRYELKKSPELYDLKNDPLEQENLVDKLPEVTSAMERNLRAWEKAHKPKYKDSAKTGETLPKEVLEEMKALGYIK